MPRIPKPLAAAAAFSAVVFALKLAVAAYPTQGLLRSDLYPLWMRWERGGAGEWLFAAAALAAIPAIPAARRALLAMPRGAFLVAAIGLCVTIWIAFAASNGGIRAGLTAPFERDEDYIHDVGTFGSATETLRTWVARQPELSLHSKTHPPGAVLVLRALERDRVGIALGLVLLSALTLLPLYAWASEHLDETGARAAVLLWASTPAVLLYGATCMDMVFALPLVTAGWLLLGRRGETTAGAVLGGIALAVGAMMTFSAVVLALAVAIATSSKNLAHRTLAGAACIAALLLIRVAFGYDWLASLLLASRLDAAEWPAWSSAGYYLVTRLMGVLDFLILAGVALAPLALAAWVRGVRGDRALTVASRAGAIAAAAVLLAGAYKIGETGRILVFLLPMLAIPVAKRLRHDGAAIGWTAALGVAQALLFEAVLDTRW